MVDYFKRSQYNNTKIKHKSEKLEIWKASYRISELWEWHSSPIS